MFAPALGFPMRFRLFPFSSHLNIAFMYRVSGHFAAAIGRPRDVHTLECGCIYTFPPS